MEYRPRYPQPFTLEQIVQLDVITITEEISRIQNSLEHLQRTQKELLEALADDPDDADFKKAYEENEDVVGSQQERITMLQLALTEKGIPTTSHYDPAPSSASQSARAPPTLAPAQAPPPNVNGDQQRVPVESESGHASPMAVVDEDGGIDL